MYPAGREDRADIEAWKRQRRALTAKGNKPKDVPAEKRLWNWEPYPIEGVGPEPAPARQQLARFVFPSDDGEQSLLWDEEVVESTTDVLAGMARIWEDSFDPKTGERVGRSSVFPTDAQLAMHGFMGVPPELVAVLSGSEYGDLKWLGATSGDIKDYMHFDLRRRPAFY